MFDKKKGVPRRGCLFENGGKTRGTKAVKAGESLVRLKGGHIGGLSKREGECKFLSRVGKAAEK